MHGVSTEPRASHAIGHCGTSATVQRLPPQILVIQSATSAG